MKDISTLTSKEQLKAEITSAYAEIERLRDLVYISKHLKDLFNVTNTISGTLQELSTLELGNSLKSFESKLDTISTGISIQIDDLAKVVSNARITEKLDSIDKYLKNTYAQAASANISPKPAPEGMVQLRHALRDEATRPEREQNVILKGIPDGLKSADIVADIATNLQVPAEELTFVPLGKKTPVTTIRIKTNSKTTASKILSKLPRMCAGDPDRFKNLTARPDYSPSELIIFRDCWKTAIEKNNAANAKNWTVVNLKLVELKDPKPWTVKPVIPKNLEANITQRKPSTMQ